MIPARVFPTPTTVKYSYEHNKSDTHASHNKGYANDWRNQFYSPTESVGTWAVGWNHFAKFIRQIIEVVFMCTILSMICCIDKWRLEIAYYLMVSCWRLMRNWISLNNTSINWTVNITKLMKIDWKCSFQVHASERIFNEMPLSTNDNSQYDYYYYY